MGSFPPANPARCKPLPLLWDRVRSSRFSVFASTCDTIHGMSDVILMLEDSPDRLARFATVLSHLAPHLQFLHWRNAPRMIRECPPYLPYCRLICLDHDLDPDGDEDPGDGLSVCTIPRPPETRLPHPHSHQQQRLEGARRMAGEV